MRLHRHRGAPSGRPVLVAIAVAALLPGCNSFYDVQVRGRVAMARPDARRAPEPGVHVEKDATDELEPVPDAVVSIAPRFEGKRRYDVAHSGPVDESGAFSYRSSQATHETLSGIEVVVRAPGFTTIERFLPATGDRSFDAKDVLIVLEDSRAKLPAGAPPTSLPPGGGSEPSPPPAPAPPAPH